MFDVYLYIYTYNVFISPLVLLKSPFCHGYIAAISWNIPLPPHMMCKSQHMFDPSNVFRSEVRLHHPWSLGTLKLNPDTRGDVHGKLWNVLRCGPPQRCIGCGPKHCFHGFKEFDWSNTYEGWPINIRIKLRNVCFNGHILNMFEGILCVLSSNIGVSYRFKGNK